MLTANYKSMVFEPHVRIMPKHCEGHSEIFNVSKMYGKFKYNDLMSLAFKGKIPKIQGMRELSPEWCKEFVYACKSMPKEVRLMLHRFDKHQHFYKTLQVAVNTCKK